MTILKPGAVPVSLRPYRYNYYQKEELERQVKEMMNHGLTTEELKILARLGNKARKLARETLHLL
uniref:Uncharacterized protein n=1 Tax=Solanum lycopersicum TaxID=4081 RepID=A0A3Q7JUD6_SOLLC